MIGKRSFHARIHLFIDDNIVIGPFWPYAVFLGLFGSKLSTRSAAKERELCVLSCNTLAVQPGFLATAISRRFSWHGVRYSLAIFDPRAQDLGQTVCEIVLPSNTYNFALFGTVCTYWNSMALVRNFRTLARVVFRETRRHRSLNNMKHLRTCVQRLNTEAAGAERQENANETFRDLFQRSKFANMLDPVNQEVEGEVLAIVKDQIYVDFGCKFHAVVPKPVTTIRKGTRVTVRILDLEMTNHFVGDHRDISLLEAEVELVDVRS